tara:strand:- start:3759 stop:4484 length:726 start_codon:yes stop_codon:yes gene_type:complete
MDNFQTNIDEPWRIAGDEIIQSFKCCPLYFHPLYDELGNDVDNSNKVLMPSSILNRLSIYDNFEYPIIFKIKDEICGVSDLIESDTMYLPNYICEKINLNEIETLDIKIYNVKPFEKAEFIKLKPYNSSFYKVQDIKKFLEDGLKKNYTHIKEKDIIKLYYNGEIMEFDIIETKPKGIVDLNETNVEVDFEKSHDYVEPEPEPEPEPDIGRSLRFNLNRKPKKETEEFVAFSGKGNVLGSS